VRPSLATERVIKMIQPWKAPHILKGMLTYVPALNSWRARRATTGGSNSSRYCYAVWLRHLTLLAQHGFKLPGAAIGELGPGDSIGTGLAAVLSGAGRYVGLDIVPYLAKADLHRIFNELAQLFGSSEPIPDHIEFPRMRPRLVSYDFPCNLIDLEFLPERISGLESVLQSRMASHGVDVGYHAPWTSAADVEPASLDLVFSQAVLQYVDNLEETYHAMFAWLKPGGYGSHSTGLGANNYSPFWNGHWAYTDLEWRLARGRRECLLNRQPLSTHLRLARNAGFDVVYVDAQREHGGLTVDALASPFRHLAAEDLLACGVMFILRKPPAAHA
jgi:SAM-dependent methyltransferase